MIPVWLLEVALQPWLDQGRARLAEGSLPDEERRRLVLTLDLVRNEKISAGDPVSAAFRAEQLRGQRLSNEQRAATIWGQLDAVELRGNAPPRAVLWPIGEERWPDEVPYVGPLDKQVLPARSASLEEELGATQKALGSPDWPAEVRAVLRYHAAHLSLTLGKPTASAGQDQAPPGLAADLLLMQNEIRFLAKEADDRMQQCYRDLEEQLPAQRSDLRVRQLQIALARNDPAEVDRLLGQEVDPSAGWYFLAVEVTRDLKQGRFAQAVAAFDRRPAEAREGASFNEALVSDALREALSQVPFTGKSVEVLEKLSGRPKLAPEVYRLGALALAKQRFEVARAAFSWCASNAPALFRLAHVKLAVVAALTKDSAALEAEMGQLLDAPELQKRAQEEVVALSRTADLRLELPPEGPEAEPQAPAIQFSFREPYALIPLPRGDNTTGSFTLHPSLP